MTLPTNIDATYGDDAGDASVKAHQQHHDAIHAFVNGGSVAPVTLPRCEYKSLGVSMTATENLWTWVDWTAGTGSDLGFRPLDLTDPTSPVVVAGGLYSVGVTMSSGSGASVRTGTTHAGAGMFAMLGLDDDGFGWLYEASADLDAAASGTCPSLTVGGTVYIPAGGVIRLYFNHTAPSPSDFTMYASVQALALDPA